MSIFTTDTLTQRYITLPGPLKLYNSILLTLPINTPNNDSMYLVADLGGGGGFAPLFFAKLI